MWWVAALCCGVFISSILWWFFFLWYIPFWWDFIISPCYLYLPPFYLKILNIYLLIFLVMFLAPESLSPKINHPYFCDKNLLIFCRKGNNFCVLPQQWLPLQTEEVNSLSHGGNASDIQVPIKMLAIRCPVMIKMLLMRYTFIKCPICLTDFLIWQNYRFLVRCPLSWYLNENGLSMFLSVSFSFLEHSTNVIFLLNRYFT